MDVLRSELLAFYASQELSEEVLDYAEVDECRRQVMTAVKVDGDCRVLTDAAADAASVFAGPFASLIGLSDSGCFYSKELASGDEDEIYSRLHPEDLVEKRMLEYEFLKFVDRLPAGEKLNYKATCRIRIRKHDGEYAVVRNSTQVMRKSPAGKVWLILCTYKLDDNQERGEDIAPGIVDFVSGQIIGIHLSERRSHILSEREKEILGLIRDGLPSKQIAGMLGISVHTVNRHRQNILEKLSVGNSLEAVKAAVAMKLL